MLILLSSINLISSAKIFEVIFKSQDLTLSSLVSLNKSPNIQLETLLALDPNFIVSSNRVARNLSPIIISTSFSDNE